MRNILHHYEIGPLLYCPALQRKIAVDILEEKIPHPFSLSLCLEDTIGDDFVELAIESLLDTIGQLYQAQYVQKQEIYFPKIYIRVRSPQQIPELVERLGQSFLMVDGFIAPKLHLGNIQDYVSKIQGVQGAIGDKPCYFMPILESRELIDLRTRNEFLYGIKEAIRDIAPLVASVRVGGTDLSHCFHLRRSVSTTIHEIPVISHLLADIMAVFSMDYLVSGAVWEYYAGQNWDKGLQRELEMDKLGGFVGKTVIHPSQIPLVLEAYQVSTTDYEDALRILDTHTEEALWVQGSVGKARMNEYKSHSHWAEHILLLAEVYGKKEELAYVSGK